MNVKYTLFLQEAEFLAALVHRRMGAGHTEESNYTVLIGAHIRITVSCAGIACAARVAAQAAHAYKGTHGALQAPVLNRWIS